MSRRLAGYEFALYNAARGPWRPRGPAGDVSEAACGLTHMSNSACNAST